MWCDGCYADVGVINISTWDTPTNLVYASANTDIRNIQFRRTNAQQGMGTLVCRGGFGSNNYVCGQVDMVDQSVLVDNLQGGAWWQTHQWRMTASLNNGDSGGPVMYGTAAFGLATAGTTRTWYTTLDYAAAAVGYRPCITAYNNPCL